MIKTNDMQSKIEELLKGDPLYAVLQDTPLEETLFTDTYLTDIIEKKFYSTPEVAGWFDITDAQLRYYIKPFEHYIFDNMTDNPSTTTLIRLNLPSILKLRMILLLKDEYRVKGLKRLLGIDENGYLVKQPPTTTALAPPDELANKVEVLSNVLQQMMQTGLFNMQQDEETGTTQITINQDYLAQNLKMLSAQSTEQLNEVQDRTEKIQKEQEGIKQQIQEIEERSKVSAQSTEQLSEVQDRTEKIQKEQESIKQQIQEFEERSKVSAQSTEQLSEVQDRTEKIQKEQESIKQQIQEFEERSKVSAQSTEQLNEVQDRTEKIQKEQESIKQLIQEIEDRSKVDIAIKIRERQIENDVNIKLRKEALQQFAKQKKSGIFAKLFRSSHLELEKEQFIETYINQHLQENLVEALKKYDHKND